jgi:hypothetical protein
VLVASLVFPFGTGWAKPVEPTSESITLKGYTPVTIASQFEPLYPGDAANRGISSGYARVGMLIDSAGQPGNFLPIEYSHEAFARALSGAVELWSFRPAMVNGVAVPSRFIVAWDFVPQQAIWQTVSEAAEAKLQVGSSRERLVYFPHNEDELDEKPKLTFVEMPQVPEGTEIDPANDRVTVVFFIDEEGKVRLPQVEQSPDPEFIVPTMAAVSKWQFTVPTVKGKPVLAIVSRRVKVIGYALSGGVPQTP